MLHCCAIFHTVTALEAQGVENLSLNFVQEALVNKELKLNGDSMCTSNNRQSLSALIGMRKFCSQSQKTKTVL